MMTIGIIGTGKIGSNLAILFAKAGYKVIISYSRSEQKLLSLSNKLGDNVSVGTIEQAVQEANITILAIRFAVMDEVISKMGSTANK